MSELWAQWPTSIKYSVCLSLSLFSQTNPPPPPSPITLDALIAAYGL